MARSRYPRRGHRLAPATLRELLDCPVPARYLEAGRDDGLRLSDLDESSWDRFDPGTCEALSAEVVLAVGRAARLPMPVGDRTLPPIPRGVTLADLDLEVRTFNCLVSAGIYERPQDLRTITIEGILGLRGFWVKCLVDLLTAVEYVIDHPEARPALRARPSASLNRPRLACRYPRPGHLLAPQTLSDILTDPLPSELVEGTPLDGMRLCHLDQRVWDCLRAEAIARLAQQVVARVNVSGRNHSVSQRLLPMPPKGMRLEDLALENRTYNCLRKQGFDKQPEDLGKCTVGEILGAKAFGAKCLVDLLTSLETLRSRGRHLDDKLTEEAEALAAIPEAVGIHFDDPRLGPLLRATDSEANTVEELVRHVLTRHLDPPDPLRLYEQLRQIRCKICELMGVSLEEELIGIFSPCASQRDKQIIAEYYGWDGGRGFLRKTLEELGRKHGLSRERIRQVCIRAVKRKGRETFFAPVLDRALAFIAGRLPAPIDRLAAEFDAAGFSSRRLPLEAVCEAAGFLSRRPRLSIVHLGDSRLVVKPEAAAIPRLIVQAARRAAQSYGAATMDGVAADVSSQLAAKVDASLVEVTLETLSEFRWLDRARGWFQLDSTPQYGLSNMIEKILSVAGEIGVSRLRTAIARYRRTGRKVPPAQVLVEFCRQMPGVRTEGKKIIADPPKDWRRVLAGVEAGMVEVLVEHGPVMERGAFEEHCVGKGMNRFSFNAVIMSSPVIAQYGRSVYGLLGAKVNPKKIEALAARKAGIVPDRVLRDYGRSDDGRFYLVYRLSKAAISGGVITVPAAMKHQLAGKFRLLTCDGREAGTLVSKEGCAWGLGPFLRSQDAEPGDFLTILFDVSEREALLEIGGDRPALEPLAPQQHAG